MIKYLDLVKIACLINSGEIAMGSYGKTLVDIMIVVSQIGMFNARKVILSPSHMCNSFFCWIN